MVLPSNYAGFIIPPEVTTPETFAWLRAEAAAPFYQTRATLRSLAVVCAFWLLFGSWYLGRLRQRYHAWGEVLLSLPGLSALSLTVLRVRDLWKSCKNWSGFMDRS